MTKKRIALHTSGGDAQGMNAAVRAVVRTALDEGGEVYAIYEGYQGMVEGGERIHKMDWDSVGGILQLGGTVIGTARSPAFMTREGRRTAALNLIQLGIDGLIIVGGARHLAHHQRHRSGCRAHEEVPKRTSERLEHGKNHN